MATPSPSFNTNPEIISRIAAAVCRDAEFLTAYHPCLEPAFFPQEVHQKIVSGALDFWQRYRRTPDRAELEHHVLLAIRGSVQNSQLQAQLIPVYQRELANLYEVPRELFQVAKDYAIDFAKTAKLKQALLDSARDLDGEGAIERAQSRLKEAALIGLNLNDFGLDYFRSARERHLKRMSQPVESMRVPFLIPQLDHYVKGVGYRRYGGIPEMCVFFAPTNRGKSRALVHCGKTSISLGLNTMIFSAEMADDLYAERFDMSMACLTTAELYDPAKTAHLERRLAMYEQQGGRLLIKKYPSRQATVADCVALLHQLNLVTGFKPDVIIYDYIDEFAPPRGATEDHRRHQLSAITAAMRASADEFGAAVFSATQTNREAMRKETFGLDSVAEDIGKFNIVDLVVAMCQSKEEEEKNPQEMRWVVCKNRSGAKGQTVRLIDEPSRMRFLQHPEETTEPTVNDFHAD